MKTTFSAELKNNQLLINDVVVAYVDWLNSPLHRENKIWYVAFLNDESKIKFDYVEEKEIAIRNMLKLFKLEKEFSV